MQTKTTKVRDIGTFNSVQEFYAHFEEIEFGSESEFWAELEELDLDLD